MFAKRLKQLRKQRKYSMQDVADSIGVAKSTYAGYESGYRQPTLETTHLIAKKLNTTTDYLLGLSDAPHKLDMTNNAKELLNSTHLHWDGIPLEEEDLELVRKILLRVAQSKSTKPPET